MRKSKLFLAITLILAGTIWVWIWRIPPQESPQSAIQAPQEGFLAPDFSLTSVSGEEIELGSLAGRPVVINFWASWCPPCRAEMPAFQQVSQEFSRGEIAILGINATSQDRISEVQVFISEYQLTFPIPLDSSGEVSRLYQVRSLPTTFFINSEGVIEEVLVGGPIPLSLLRVKIGQLLEGASDVPNN